MLCFGQLVTFVRSSAYGFGFALCLACDEVDSLALAYFIPSDVCLSFLPDVKSHDM